MSNSLHPSVKRTLIFIVSFVTIVAVSQVALIEEAKAADCADIRVCTWWNYNGTGSQYYYTGPTNGTCIDIGAPWDGNVSSAENTFNFHKVTFYDGNNCTGASCTLGVNTGRNFSPPFCWNDFASSMRIYPA